MEAGAHLEFKFVCFADEGDPLWEEGDNHAFDVEDIAPTAAFATTWRT